MRACCLVHSDWLPRGRYNLYHRAHITIRPEVSHNTSMTWDLLWRTISTGTIIATSISELSASSHGSRADIPYGILTAFSSKWAGHLKSLRSIRLEGMRWNHPRLYSLTFEHLPNVSTLTLGDISFQSMTQLFTLIWSLSKLSSLTLRTIGFARDLQEGESSRLRKSKPEKSCANLKRLAILVCTQVGCIVKVLIISC